MTYYTYTNLTVTKKKKKNNSGQFLSITTVKPFVEPRLHLLRSAGNLLKFLTDSVRFYSLGRFLS